MNYLLYRIMSESGAIAHDGGAVLFSNESLDLMLKQCQGTITVG